MWFAALGQYQGEPWLVHLAAKLLIGHDSNSGDSRSAFSSGLLQLLLSAVSVYAQTLEKTTPAEVMCEIGA